MGVVYEAEQTSLRRRVAFKVLRFGAVADEEAMQRFRREAETVARLHHTNIVPIFAVGCERGVHYYAMQFIEGRSLADVLAESQRAGKPLPSAEIARWGLQAAEALAHAHQRGVIHRDIKPSNLLLDTEGIVWLTDFGLAKRADEVTLTLCGTLMGTPRYMSPEQAESVQRPIDHRTDIYSLGASLYELATGRPVFDATAPMGVIAQILTEEPARPRQIRPDLPRDLETVILTCLAKDPAQRYPTAQALAEDLRAVHRRPADPRRRAPRSRSWYATFASERRPCARRPRRGGDGTPDGRSIDRLAILQRMAARPRGAVHDRTRPDVAGAPRVERSADRRAVRHRHPHHPCPAGGRLSLARPRSGLARSDIPPGGPPGRDPELSSSRSTTTVCRRSCPFPTLRPRTPWC